MKRICFIGFGLFTIGGCQRVTISLANELCEKYETHLLSLCEIPKDNKYYLKPEVKVHTFNMPLDMRARKSLVLGIKLIKFLRKNKIDILFIAGSLPIPLVCMISPFVNIKIVFCDHENLYGRDSKSIAFRKVISKLCDKVVVLTKRTLSDYIDILKVNPKKLVQIYNSIDTGEIIKNDTNAKKIISVGRISSEKGFDMAVDVAKKVFEKHSDWQWDIYGDGPDFERIQGKIEKYGLKNNLVLKGSNPDVMKEYKNYSICVLPSYREGFAMVLIEAKINSLPVVSFDCVAGPSEIINDGIDGFLVPCYDINFMAEKICELIEDEDLRERFSQCASANLDKFDTQKIVNQWCDLIERI